MPQSEEARLTITWSHTDTYHVWPTARTLLAQPICYQVTVVRADRGAVAAAAVVLDAIHDDEHALTQWWSWHRCVR